FGLPAAWSEQAGPKPDGQTPGPRPRPPARTVRSACDSSPRQEKLRRSIRPIGGTSNRRGMPGSTSMDDVQENFVSRTVERKRQQPAYFLSPVATGGRVARRRKRIAKQVSTGFFCQDPSASWFARR